MPSLSDVSAGRVPPPAAAAAGALAVGGPIGEAAGGAVGGAAGGAAGGVFQFAMDLGITRLYRLHRCGKLFSSFLR